MVNNHRINILIIVLLSIFHYHPVSGSDSLTRKILSFEEFCGIIKKYHPIVQRSYRQIDIARNENKIANAAFIPKFELQTGQKKLVQPYYNLLNANFKIPTWYGIDFKLQYERNIGTYVDPEHLTSEEGLFTMGISVPLVDGLIQNENRTRTLQSKIAIQSAENDVIITLNQLMMEAVNAYWEWTYQYYNWQLAKKLYQKAEERHRNVRLMFVKGDRSASDTLETFASLQDRSMLVLESKKKYMLSLWALNTFLWLDNQPYPLSVNVMPDSVKTVLPSVTTIDTNISYLPSIRYYDYKLKQLNLDMKLKKNKIFPDVYLDYNLLNKGISTAWTNNDYKWRISVALPIWIQKELSDIRITKYKIKQTELDKQYKQAEVTNKINSYKEVIEILKQQNQNIDQIVENYTTLLKQEEIKFQIGESSIFLIISRENKIFELQQKQLLTRVEYYKYTNLLKAIQMQFN